MTVSVGGWRRVAGWWRGCVGWWRRHPDNLGFTLLALVSFGVSMAYGFGVPLLWGADERAHAGYAIELLHGNLPTIRTPVLDDPERFPELSRSLAGWEGIGRQVWVANHPPLYYLISAPLIGLAEWLGIPAAGLFGMRVLNAAATAGTVVLAGLLARELVPRRTEVPMLAAVLTAAAFSLSIEGGYGYNDGVAGLTGTATLLCGVRLLRRTPTWRLLAAAGATAALAAAARAPNLLAVAGCVVMATAAVAIHLPDRRPWRALAAAALVGGVPAVTVGWFYMRNLTLYGDLTGAAPLLRAFQRGPGQPFLDTLTSGGFHRRMLESFWIRPHLHPYLVHLVDLLLAAAVLGLLLLLVDRLRRTTRVTGKTPEQRGPRLARWILVGHAVLVLMFLIDFRSDGGYLRQRYLLGIVPSLMTVLAVGLVRLAEAVPHPDSRRAAAATTLGIGGGMLLLGFITFPASRHVGDRGPIPADLPAAVGPPWPHLALWLAASAAVGWALLRLCAIRQPYPPGPGDDERACRLARPFGRL